MCVALTPTKAGDICYIADLTIALFPAVGVPDAGEGAETEHRRPEEQPPPRVRTAPLVRQHSLRGDTEDEAQDEGEYNGVQRKRLRMKVSIMGYSEWGLGWKWV